MIVNSFEGEITQKILIYYFYTKENIFYQISYIVKLSLSIPLLKFSAWRKFCGIFHGGLYGNNFVCMHNSKIIRFALLTEMKSKVSIYALFV